MTQRGRLLAALAVAAFVGLLVWSTLSGQKAECEVCVSFEGGDNCATASAASEEDAARAAQETACGPLARGMNASIACGNRPPTRRTCRRT